MVVRVARRFISPTAMKAKVTTDMVTRALTGTLLGPLCGVIHVEDEMIPGATPGVDRGPHPVGQLGHRLYQGLRGDGLQNPRRPEQGGYAARDR